MTSLDKAQRRFGSAILALVIALACAAALSEWLAAQALDPIVSTVRAPAPDTHFVEVEAVVPTGGRASDELMSEPGSVLLIDDAAGRIEAARRGILTAATLGVLRAAALKELVHRTRK